MDINSSFNSQWQAIQSAAHAMQRHGDSVARNNGRTPRSEEHDTETVVARPPEEQAHPGAAVVRATEETLGSLINIRA